MLRTFEHLLLTFMLVTSVVAQAPGRADTFPTSPSQNAPPTSSPPSSKLPSQEAPRPKSGAGTTIQTRTNLVVVDVVVTDHAGKNVHGLQRSDFILAEKGIVQPLRSFDEHVAPAEAVKLPEPLDLPPGIFTNFSPAPTSSALNILLVDNLNTPLESQAYLRAELLKYVRMAPAGNRIAIFGLSTQLILLQGFTSDPYLLRAAIDKKSVRPSQILSNATSGDPEEELSRNLVNSGADSHGGLSVAAARLAQFEAETQSFELQMRVRYTLSAMGQLARYLSALPGRKNLIWFSGSFPLDIFPNGQFTDPFAAFADISGEFRETTNLLTRSQVAVYPVDARGLFNAPMYDASEPDARYASNPGAFGADLQKFAQQTAAEHATMLQMAEATGGHAFINTNGLANAVETAISTGSNFYTLTYTPTNAKYDGNFRKIGLKISGRFAPYDLHLAYRRGYYAIDPRSPAAHAKPPVAGTPAGPGRPAGSGSPAELPSANVIRAAMLRGAPEPTQIVFKVRILPATPLSDAPEANPDPGTRLNTDVKRSHGPYRRYVVDLAAIASQVLLVPTASGGSSGAVEFLTHVYDADGALVTATSGTVTLTLTPENQRHLAGTSLPFHMVISVPAKGEFYFRVGVHDLMSDRVGAVEVPVASVKKLLPLSPGSASSDTPVTGHP